MSSPQVLVINVEHDIGDEFRRRLTARFGSTYKWSSYSRPFQSGHPRLRPYQRSGDPKFQVIVLDIGTEWAKLDSEELIDKQITPEWFQADFLETVKNACVIVLSPAKILNGVNANLSAAWRRRSVKLVVRDSANWGNQFPDPAEEIYRCVEHHQHPPIPIADRLLEWFRV